MSSLYCPSFVFHFFLLLQVDYMLPNHTWPPGYASCHINIGLIGRDKRLIKFLYFGLVSVLDFIRGAPIFLTTLSLFYLEYQIYWYFLTVTLLLAPFFGIMNIAARVGGVHAYITFVRKRYLILIQICPLFGIPD